MKEWTIVQTVQPTKITTAVRTIGIEATLAVMFINRRFGRLASRICLPRSSFSAIDIGSPKRKDACAAFAGRRWGAPADNVAGEDH